MARREPTIRPAAVAAVGAAVAILALAVWRQPAAIWYAVGGVAVTAVFAFAADRVLARVADRRSREARELDEARRLRLLYDVGRLVTGSLHSDQVFENSLGVLREHFGHSIASIWVVDEQAREIWAAARLGFPPDLQLPRLTMGQGLIGRAVASGQPLYVADVSVDPRYVPSVPTIRSEADFPLKAGSKVVGCLCVQSSRVDGFGAEDLQLLGAFADWLAVAVNNARLYDEQERLATTDPMTGIYNYRFAQAFLERELLRAHREGSPTAVLMLDIDHFKAINDEYGHDAGDLALRGFAQMVRTMLRGGDVVARYGGEEFLAVLPATDLRGALTVAEHVREATERLCLTRHGMPLPSVTVSVGVATAGPDDEAGPAALMKAADQACYDAKQSGRNRVRAACARAAVGAPR